MPNYIKEHIDEILKHMDVEAIKARHFKVGVDMINASACVVDPYLFKMLGVEYVSINNIPDGKFGHKPEPLKENLSELAKLVMRENCDVGFAHDPDADRLVIVNEKGEVISEEYTLAFGVEAVTKNNPRRNVVINMSTSQVVADLAKNNGCETIRTKVGEANVMEGIIKNNAVVGGEGSGGVIYPPVTMCRDGFVSLAFVLDTLARRNMTVSACVDEFPKYFIKKEKMNFDGNTETLKGMYEKLKNHFTDAMANELDGLRLDFPSGAWIHLRPSNTEPIVRLIGEAKNEEEIEKVFIMAQDIVSVE